MNRTVAALACTLVATSAHAQASLNKVPVAMVAGAARTADTVNVLDYGVKGDGVTDDAPALSAVCSNASSKYIVLPGNRTYLLKSSRIAGVYPGGDPGLMLCSKSSDIHILAYGATLKTDASVGLTAAVFMDRSTNWTWDGGTVVGNRTGLSSSAENVGMALDSNVGFRVSGIHFVGYGGNGAAFAGDWDVNGELSSNNGAVGHAYDLAFLKNVAVHNNRFIGADTNGNTGAGQIGSTGFSNIYDTFGAIPLSVGAVASGASTVGFTLPNGYLLVLNQPYPISTLAGIPSGTLLVPTSTISGYLVNAAGVAVQTTAALTAGATLTAQYNFTGIFFDDTDGVVVSDDLSNFATPVLLASGSNYTLGGNLHDNPGISNAKGLGYYIVYNNGGGATSVGHPVKGVTIGSGTIANNGSVVPGYGVLIDASAVTNADAIDGVTITGATFDNNNSTAIGVASPVITLSASLGISQTLVSYTSPNAMNLGVAYPLVPQAGIPPGTTFTPTSATAGTLSSGPTLAFGAGAGLTIAAVQNLTIGTNTYRGSAQTTRLDPTATLIVQSAPTSGGAMVGPWGIGNKFPGLATTGNITGDGVTPFSICADSPCAPNANAAYITFYPSSGLNGTFTLNANAFILNLTAKSQGTLAGPWAFTGPASFKSTVSINKSAAIPTSAPGAGVCIETWVPANLTSPAGTAGTCSKIAMCGTSTAYTIETPSVGSGC